MDSTPTSQIDTLWLCFSSPERSAYILRDPTNVPARTMSKRKASTGTGTDFDNSGFYRQLLFIFVVVVAAMASPRGSCYARPNRSRTKCQTTTCRTYRRSHFLQRRSLHYRRFSTLHFLLHTKTALPPIFKRSRRVWYSKPLIHRRFATHVCT